MCRMLRAGASSLPRHLPTHLQWHEELLQPIHRCVDHLIMVILRTIEMAVSKLGDSHDMESISKLTKAEIDAFVS